MKPLLLKLIPLQVSSSSYKNFSFQQQLYSSTSYHLFKKVPQGLTVIKFRKCSNALLNGCFSNHPRKELLCSFLLKSGITKNSSWWRVVSSWISHASDKVLLRVVKFYRQIFSKYNFSNTMRRLLLKLTRNNESFLIQSQAAEHQRISYRFFSNFPCVLLLSSILAFSVLIFEGIKWKCYSISVNRVMLNLLGPKRGIFVNRKAGVVVKICFYYKCLTMVIFGFNICYF